MAEPTVFIGSSTEQLETAHALKQCLGSEVQVVVWDEADFALTESTFGALLQMAVDEDGPTGVTRVVNSPGSGGIDWRGVGVFAVTA